ncbi:MAG: CRP-like cAMP-binding protein [Sulfurimonas sp.]|jgi:CRP-like cAMP-binding protein|uniref:Crp/Fnr family transcriptional regulator n=1 Tax=Sulfurimonas sp. TaxID=2022749 RepID=UPI0039E72975
MLDILKKVLLFENLSDDTLKSIQKDCVIVSLKKDNIVFYEGDESRYLYLVLEGKIKLYKTLANDNELVLKYFKEDEMIAEVAVFDGFDYPATAEANSDVKLLKIDCHNLKELFLNNPDILMQINTSLIKKIKNLESVLSRYLILDAKSRVVEYILENSDEFFTLKQHEIASFLNISPETLSRMIKPFKADGIIDMKNKKINTKRLALYKS